MATETATPRKTRGRQAEITVPAFDKDNLTDAQKTAISNSELEVVSKSKVLKAEKASDHKEHKGNYLDVTVTSHEAALAVLGGNEETIWEIVSDWLTKRNILKLGIQLRSDAEGPERKVGNAVKDLLRAGFYDVAVASYGAALKVSAEDAKAAVDKIKASL